MLSIDQGLLGNLKRYGSKKLGNLNAEWYDSEREKTILEKVRKVDNWKPG